MATPLSIRLKDDTLQRLYFQARVAGMPPRTLAQRMVEEALRRMDHPQIEFYDNGPARRAVIRGTGLEVWELIQIVKAHGGDVEAAMESTGRSRVQVEAAIAYYGAYPEDIDVLVEENERAYAEGRAAYLAGLDRLSA